MARATELHFEDPDDNEEEHGRIIRIIMGVFLLMLWRTFVGILVHHLLSKHCCDVGGKCVVCTLTILASISKASRV